MNKNLLVIDLNKTITTFFAESFYFALITILIVTIAIGFCFVGHQPFVLIQPAITLILGKSHDSQLHECSIALRVFLQAIALS